MSFPKLLRYQRHFRNFWRTIEEYLDQLRAEQRVHSSKYDGASFIISLFALEATA